jgi:hypothetical protein
MRLLPLQHGGRTRRAWRVLPGFLLAAAALVAACRPPQPVAKVADDLALVDINGVALGTLSHPARGRWSTLIFVASDCPISNHYVPEIRRICAAYETAGAQCTLVYGDTHLQPEHVRAHLQEFSLNLPAVIDRDRTLVARAGATVTPQVAVFTSDGEPAYSGRIDDLYAELGRPRQGATVHDLRNALDDLAAGRAVRTPRTRAIGCYIE